MHAIYYNPSLTDDERRKRIFDGDLIVYSATDSSTALAEFSQSLIREAFAPFDPETAQYELPVERYAEILGELKPKFTHHPTCKKLIGRLFEELGCDVEKTYFDVPKLRTSTSDEYLTTGIAFFLASSSRYLVCGTDVPDQLVDANLRCFV